MPVNIDQILRLAEPWTAPISPNLPGGVRADEDERYVAVTTEIAMLESPIAGRGPKLARIIDCGGELLREKSKDLLIASYVSYALHRQDGPPGLLTGLALLTVLIESYWETMFPEVRRIRGRVNALQWFIERAQRQLAAYQPVATDRAAFEHAVVATRRLYDSARERFDDYCPAIRPLQEHLERTLFDLDSAPSPQIPVVRVPAIPLLPSDPWQASTWLRELGPAMVQAAHSERRASRGSALAYRMMRQGLYAHITAPPPLDPSGRSRIPPPPQALYDRMAMLVRDQAWALLVDEAESALFAHRFWLDLHRYVALALPQLGDSYTRAHQEVVRETVVVVRRMPTLFLMHFSDGTPFADEKTRRWLLSATFA